MVGGSQATLEQKFNVCSGWNIKEKNVIVWINQKDDPGDKTRWWVPLSRLFSMSSDSLLGKSGMNLIVCVVLGYTDVFL